MTTLAIEQVQETLPKLIDDVRAGEHVLITQNRVPVAELIPVQRPNHSPVFGSAKGILTMSKDFDKPIDDFQGYRE